jgi:hypothetical protein
MFTWEADAKSPTFLGTCGAENQIGCVLGREADHAHDATPELEALVSLLHLRANEPSLHVLCQHQCERSDNGQGDE